jgi:hypothetical protein
MYASGRMTSVSSPRKRGCPVPQGGQLQGQANFGLMDRYIVSQIPRRASPSAFFFHILALSNYT